MLALLLAIIGIHAGNGPGRRAIRNQAVASGAGILSWMLFLPFSLAFGWALETTASIGPDGAGRRGGGRRLLLIVVRASARRAAQPGAVEQAQERTWSVRGTAIGCGARATSTWLSSPRTVRAAYCSEKVRQAVADHRPATTRTMSSTTMPTSSRPTSTRLSPQAEMTSRANAAGM